MTTARTVDYALEGRPHEGLLVFDETRTGPAPTVLAFHAWDGRTEAHDAFAHRLAALGWNGFAVDVYGKGVTGKTTEECQALMNPLAGDRARLRAVLLAAVDAVAALPEVDEGAMAAIGFCFGGLCVLDLARAGAPLKGVASFHGLFAPPGLPSVTPIGPKVAAYHGWDDPMVPPEAVVGFGQEFTRDGADWRLHAFGGAMHGFMAEGANMPQMGIQYDAKVAARAWASLAGFLDECLGG
jgi:dienelactone hydrolase